MLDFGNTFVEDHVVKQLHGMFGLRGIWRPGPLLIANQLSLGRLNGLKSTF